MGEAKRRKDRGEYPVVDGTKAGRNGPPRRKFGRAKWLFVPGAPDGKRATCSRGRIYEKTHRGYRRVGSVS